MADMMECAEEMAKALHKVLDTISVQTASGCRPGRDNFNDAVRTARTALTRYEASK